MKINSLHFTLIFTCFAGLLPFATSAQEKDPVLVHLIEKGLEKSHSLNINQLETEQAKVDQKLA